jgi:hypothetical protein
VHDSAEYCTNARRTNNICDEKFGTTAFPAEIHMLTYIFIYTHMCIYILYTLSTYITKNIYYTRLKSYLEAVSSSVCAYAYRNTIYPWVTRVSIYSTDGLPQRLTVIVYTVVSRAHRNHLSNGLGAPCTRRTLLRPQRSHVPKLHNRNAGGRMRWSVCRCRFFLVIFYTIILPYYYTIYKIYIYSLYIL